MIGQKFGYWAVVDHAPSSKFGKRWTCLCDCGVVKIVTASSLRNGSSKSCGCYSTKATIARSTTHDMTKNPVYRAWQAMKNRCSMNTTRASWKHYGGRGIAVCDRWLHSFENFYADMGDTPFPKAELDRIDNNKGYFPGNCKWSTRTEQNRNSRHNHLVTCYGKTQTLAQWIEETGICRMTIWRRMKKGLPIEQVLKPASPHCVPTERR